MDWYTVGAESRYTQYRVYQSEKISKLEALVNGDNKGYLQLDGRVFCIFDLNTCMMNFESSGDHKLLDRTAAVEEKINKVMLIGENYAYINLREAIEGRSKLLDNILPLFPDAQFSAVSSYLPGKFKIELKIPMDEKCSREVYKRAYFKELTNRRYDMLISDRVRMDTLLAMEFPGNVPKLYAIVSGDKPYFNEEIKLSRKEEKAIMDTFEEHFGMQPENFLADRLMENEVIVRTCKEICCDIKHKAIYAKFGLSERSESEVCKRSGVLAMMDDFASEKYQVGDLKAVVTDGGVKVGIVIKSNVEQTFRVPFSDIEKNALIKALNDALGMPYDIYMKKRICAELYDYKKSEKKSSKTETISKT